MNTDIHQSLNAIAIAASTPEHFVVQHWERTVKQKTASLATLM
jgi:hypothetical protein